MKPLAVAAVLAATTGAAAAQDGWDADGDGRLTREEFAAGIGDIFARFDRDDDSRIGPEEAAGFASFGLDWRAWDADADGLLTQGEFASGVFDAYDENGDGAIAGAEMGGERAVAGVEMGAPPN